LLGYTPDGLHPDTVRALAQYSEAPPEMVDVSGDDFAYWRAVRQRWTGEDDLVLIEQDNVIHESVIPQFMTCSGEWCVFPYLIFNSKQRLTQGLGCTKFSASLQRRAKAEGFEADGSLYTDGKTGIPWNFLDLIIAERLRLGHGLQPHVHEPDIEHRHDYSGVPVIGRDEDEGRRRADDPFAVYHREIPVVFSPQVLKPATMVYGVSLTDVASLEDAARLANSLAARYMDEKGKPLSEPAQLDTSRPPAMRFKTDKVQQGYLPSYLKIASEIGLNGRVCEIGVWQGESLQMWQALFPGGLVCGVDRDVSARWPHETAQVIASQDDENLPARLREISPDGWDVIVDDASHAGVLTRRTWELLWPLVVPGGVYVVEDWFVGFGKHHLFPDDHTMLDTARSFLDLLDRPGNGKLLSGQLESAEYRYGMIILRKAR